MQAALEELRAKIAEAAAVVFFYSGHGYQINGINHLLPVGTAIDPAQPQLSIEKIFRSLSGAPNEAVKIIFLDACRSNVNLATLQGGRLGNVPGWRPGLADFSASTPPQTVFGYAATFGQTAVSGARDEISPYTAALLRSIREPGLELRPFLARVRREVLASTRRRQSPDSRGIANLTQDFLFREAIKIRMDLEAADDDLFVVLGGEVVRTRKRDESAAARAADPLPLKAGENELMLLVYNQPSHRNTHSWDVTEGWNYKMTLERDDGKKIEGADADGKARFEDGEGTPFKNGPRHGQLFKVATAVLHVDEQSSELALKNPDTDVWERDAPVWAGQQDLLYERLLTTLPLGEILGLGGGFDVISLLQQLLGLIGPIRQVRLPDFDKLFVTVRGNRRFREAVQVAMVQQEADRIADLKKGIADFFAGVARPFEEFDRALSRAVAQEVIRQPGNDLAPGDVRVWTAFENRSFMTPAILALDSREVGTPDLLLQPRQGEALLGPVTIEQDVLGVPVSTRVSAFLILRQEADQVRIAARVVADLSDLQQKIGPLVDTIPLPTDNCSRFGLDNLVARIWGKQMAVDGDVATIQLNGDVDIWACAKNPVPCTRIEWEEREVLFGGRIRIPRLVTYDCNPPVKSRLVNQPFEATIPFRLTVVDPHTVGVELGDPTVNLGGVLGGVTERILTIAGVDVSGRMKAALERAINPDLLKGSLPDELLRLNPTMTRAELLSNSGALAASFEMDAAVEGNALSVLVELLRILLSSGG